ncbi:ligase-associated DNA damage response exonuclease [Mongoliitalea daihaiensis]|uniref:ligase-associated DNA damage response exonuclease n=1 Tax=Mongoliitalea daihaiensis TaxID=2782006 RepID=UPI001F37E548|nr:ligase-associated DNA damage response exonuclease [Mongoliitalea daihaiensis]UJP64701.1 ligase-associated DNA damage response exonuclease [Mongoliitalea daihaiensis]
MSLLELTPKGLYCPPADIFIDPWRPVDYAVITHAHSDHSRWGMKHYLAHQDSAEVMKLRLGSDISLQTISYQEPLFINGVEISLIPAGHIPGSAQVKITYQGKTVVVSGDYKIENDGLSTPFEPVKCHEFVSECTFGMPMYDWEPQSVTFEKINRWWSQNAAQDRNSVLFAYSLGKAQRILQHLNSDIGEIFVHGAIWNTNEALINNGISLRKVEKVSAEINKSRFKKAMILAPPSAMGTPWMKKFGPYRTGICSGWMSIRGTRRRRAADAGFVLSDHADWKGLIQAIQATEAETVYLTHGSKAVFAKYLQEEKGIHAVELETLFEGENSNFTEE